MSIAATPTRDFVRASSLAKLASADVPAMAVDSRSNPANAAAVSREMKMRFIFFYRLIVSHRTESRDMKKRTWALLRLIVGMGILASRVCSATSNDPEIKALMRRYTDVEAQLNRSIHYLKSETAEGVTTIRQAWLDGANDLIKVAVRRSYPAGRARIQYVAHRV